MGRCGDGAGREGLREEAKSDKANKLAESKINALKEQQIRRLHEKLIHKNEVSAEPTEEKTRVQIELKQILTSTYAIA